MGPECGPSSTQQQVLGSQEDAVALISLDGALSAAVKVVNDDVSHFQTQDKPSVQLHAEQTEIRPVEGTLSVLAPDLSTAAAELQETQQPGCSQPSTPTGWRQRMFNTGRQEKQPQMQAQAQQLPPGCLVLDGEALLWHAPGQEQQQQQKPCLGSSGPSSGVSWGKQLMRTSSSSPNLAQLAEGSTGSMGPSTSQQQQQGSHGDDLPMHSSQSCGSFVSLCDARPAAPAAAYSTSSIGANYAPKSRLGRPTSEGGHRQQAQQRAEQGQGQQQDNVQEQQDMQGQQQDMQAHPASLQQQELRQNAFDLGNPGPSSFDFDSSGHWSQMQQQQQHGFSPHPQQPQSPLMAAVEASSSSARVTSWTFSRCDSGLSLGSQTLGRKLRLHCATLNMNGKLPASLPQELLGVCGALQGADRAGSPDLLVFATQENAYISEWEKLLGGVLKPAGYERLAYHSLRAIHLVLFAGRRFRRQVLSIHGSAVATGIGNVVGNKGAVALSVELLDLKLLFISSHLAAHGDQVQQRNADYQRIKAGLFSSTATPMTPRSPLPGSGNTTERSPRNVRASLDVPRSQPMSAPLARAANSDNGGKPSLEIGSGSSSGAFSGGLSGRTTSGVWAGLLRSNRVMDSSPFDDPSSDSPAAALGKHVSWWAEGSLSRNQSPTCASPLLSLGLSAPSAGQLGQQPSCSSPSASGLALNRLRVASCPAMDKPQHLQQQGGGDSGGSSGAASGTASPAFGSSLAAADRTGSMTASFMRALVGKQSGKDSGNGRSVDALESHDMVCWLGDLNYRINGNSKAVRHLMRSRLHEVLHANDQLRLQQKMGTVFQGFQEGNITFPPTFKFLPGSSAYSEKRVPSWTDRILWKVRSSPQQQQQLSNGGGEDSMHEHWVPPVVSQLYYSSVPEVTSSDHKPVIAGFEVAVLGEEEQEEMRLSQEDEEDRLAQRRRCCMPW